MSKISQETEPARPDDANGVDASEIEQFERLAGDWWDPQGPMRPLHRLNPVRIGYIRDRAIEQFGLDAKSLRPLAGLRLLDVGCGGGLTCEPLVRLGAEVTGIDPASQVIEAARWHAEEAGLAVDYRLGLIDDLPPDRFDVVLALEVVEHVPDQSALVVALARRVRPGGLIVMSTLNRTTRSFASAIVGAEYVLGWLPRGTHRWSRFVAPSVLAGHMRRAGLRVANVRGISYKARTDSFALSTDRSVNYLITASR